MSVVNSSHFRDQAFETSPLPIVILDSTTLQVIECNLAALNAYRYTSKEQAIGTIPIDGSAEFQYDGSLSKEKALYYINRAKNEGSVVFEWKHERPDGEQWDAQVHLRSFNLHDHQFLQYTLIDITDQKINERNNRILHDLLMELNTCITIQEGAETVARYVTTISSIDCMGLYLLNPPDGSFRLVVSKGLSDDFCAMASWYPSDAPQVLAVKNGQTQSGMYDNLIFEKNQIRINEHIKGYASIPIKSKSTLVAILNVGSHSSLGIPDKSRTLLETIAYQTGSSLMRLQSDTELRESEEIFNQLMINSPIYIFFKDEKIRPIRLSANYSRMLGIPVERAIGKTMHELFPKELADGIVADDTKILNEGKLVTVDEELAGTYYTTIKYPISIEGKPRYLAGFTIDITERIKAEQSLKHLITQFEAFMDNMQSMIMIKDDELRPIFFNREFEKYFPAAEWRNKKPHEVFPAEIADKVIEDDRTAISKGFILIEEEWVDNNGSVHILETRKFRMNRSDTPPYLGVIINDITDRKTAEKATINNQKLESLGVLAGGIAHDFNNLLGGIFGYIDLAHSETNEHKRTQYISKAMTTIERARALTMQLLTFSKGGAPVKKLDTITDTLQETTRFALSGSSVSCDFSISDAIWQCEFDKNQIAQVIDNIVLNAVQAMPGGGTLKVAAENCVIGNAKHSVVRPGNYVKIMIADKGTGIPKKYLTKIFDPFFTTKSTGHGLGLATCYSIIKRHDGFIDVTSEPDKGTTFCLYLPAVHSVNPDTPHTDHNHIHKGSGIFVIMDDEEVIRDSISSMVESFGYSAVSFENGLQTIDYVTGVLNTGKPPSGMLFDLTIPGGSGGKEAIQIIRQYDKTIPVFVSSGYNNDPVMAEPAKYGFTASIPKPFTKSELAALLNKYINS
ncbi:MAG: PAS domain-containing protein [Fibrobacterota bacterium]|nr:PAS domain-containing protein [Chitinispirillaceae bacterium]